MAQGRARREECKHKLNLTVPNGAEKPDTDGEVVDALEDTESLEPGRWSDEVPVGVRVDVEGPQRR